MHCLPTSMWDPDFTWDEANHADRSRRVPIRDASPRDVWFDGMRVTVQFPFPPPGGLARVEELYGMVKREINQWRRGVKKAQDEEAKIRSHY